MSDTYFPMGSGTRPLTEGAGLGATSSPFGYLSNVATWFNKEGRQHCATAFIDKAMDFYDERLDVLDRHFGLAHQCSVVYRWRDREPGALEKAIKICEMSISFHKEAAIGCSITFGLIPAHACFQQLRIIEERRKNFLRAIQLCEMAKEGGWAGSWDKDIARIRKKLATQ